jgi:hypothetical protein
MPKTNTRNTMKNRSCLWKTTNGKGRVMEEVKKVKYFLHKKKYRIFKHVEISISRGLRQKGEK